MEEYCWTMTGSEEVTLRPVSFQCVVSWVSVQTAPHCTYICSWPHVHSGPICAELPDRNYCVSRGTVCTGDVWTTETACFHERSCTLALPKYSLFSL